MTAIEPSASAFCCTWRVCSTVFGSRPTMPVSKLQEELAIARRLDWIRKGISGDVPKGGVLMQQGAAAFGSAPKTNFGLNVEIGSESGVKVTTNAPAPPK